VRSEAVTRATLAEVARWSGKLALLAEAQSFACAVTNSPLSPQHPSLANACDWLLSARVALQKATRSNPSTAEDTEMLRAIPANSVPDRRPPQPGESIAVLAEGIENSAARLLAIVSRTAGQAVWSPAATADSWKWTATAAAIISHLSEHLLRSMARRASQWACPRGTNSMLGAAAEATGDACAQWRAVAVAWDGLYTETRGLTAPGITDMGDLVLRVGRLAFTDPDWTPARARKASLRDPAELTPAAVLVTTLHQAADALAQVATAALRDVRAAEDAERLYTPTRTLPATYDIPYPYWHAPPATADVLLGAYKEAVRASNQAATALGTAAVCLGVPNTRLLPHLAGADLAENASPELVGTALAADVAEARTSPTPGIADSAVLPPADSAELALHGLRSVDPILRLQVRALDKAVGRLVSKVSDECAQAATPGQADSMSPPAKAAESFPNGLHRSGGDRAPAVSHADANSRIPYARKRPPMP
jgi:hypothetical protein